jgi:LPS-assembly protein
MLRTAVLLSVLIFLSALPARAQVGAAPPSCQKWQAASQDAAGYGQTHYVLLRNVVIDCNDIQLFADSVEVFSDADRLYARGNVLFVSTDNRISADSLDFNTRTKTGTFHVASGIASIANRGVDRSFFGTQEPAAYFWGSTIEKLGPKTYRITHGGFTTCVQPTPRWELVSNSAIVTLDDHALMKNTLLMVKNVPVFYLPIMYYPINKEDRATGFLTPQYGTSSIRGQTISNAFFWAIDRSRDATFYGDYFSKTGYGYGGEYEYVQAPGSQGKIDVDVIREHDYVYPQPDGTQIDHPADSSYSITGSMSQKLPLSLHLSGRADYFSSLTSQQRYQQNIYQATNTTRSFGVNLTGNWGADGLSVATDHSEVFSNTTSSNVVGSLPRIDFTRAEKQIGSLPIYFGATSEFVTLIRQGKSGTTVLDQGLSRFDVLPTVRIPFTKLPFLTFNSTVSFRETYWTESLDTTTGAPVPPQVSQPIDRRYMTFSTSITGPVLSRVFSTPKRRYAQKFKHVIEPVFTVSRTTAIDNYNDIVKLEGIDSVVGKVTSVQYGLNNRLYAKKQSSRQILSVSISQSYYTNGQAAVVDPQYQASFTQGLRPTNFSPVALLANVTPTTDISATFRTEYDTQVHALRTVAANGSFNRGWVQATGGWSEQRYIPQLPGFNILTLATQYLNATTTIRKPGNPFGGNYSFNYDLRNGTFLNQQWMAYYNSQCCGVSIQYQTINYGANVNTIGVPRDHRFNISFTLAGVGSFSNLLGSFGGQTGR